MSGRGRIIGSAGLVAAILLGGALATAAPRAAFAAPQAEVSPKVHQLATQLAEEWLKEQDVAKPAAPPAVQQTRESFGDYVNSRAGAFRDQILALTGAIPDLPNQFGRAVDRVTLIDADSGKGQVFLDLGIFGDKYRLATRRLAAEAHAILNLVLIAACGFGAQRLFRGLTAKVRGRLYALPMETVNDRLRRYVSPLLLG